MKKIKPIIFVLFLVLSGCWTEDNGDKYYELSYSDEVSASLSFDTIHIVLMQSVMSNYFKDSIPYSMVNNIQAGDTIKMKFDVNFGSYSQTPFPVKSTKTSNDTLYVWYSYTSAPSSFQKSSSIMQSEQPKLPYYSIQNIRITKSASKYLTFYSINKK